MWSRSREREQRTQCWNLWDFQRHGEERQDGQMSTKVSLAYSQFHSTLGNDSIMRVHGLAELHSLTQYHSEVLALLVEPHKITGRPRD